MKKRIELAAIASLAILTGSTPARAQAVEIFAGDDASTVDVMFFNYFKDGAGQSSPVLLFHRSRVLVDYGPIPVRRRRRPSAGHRIDLGYNGQRRGLHAARILSDQRID